MRVSQHAENGPDPRPGRSRFPDRPAAGRSRWDGLAALLAALWGFLAIPGPLLAVESRPVVDAHGTLVRNGRPYRAIGVNGYDLFVRTLADPGATNRLDAFFEPLARLGIPFVRFSACGYWPKDWTLFRTQPEAHAARFDAVIAAARRHGVGLIPSLFWHHPTLPDLVGEPVSAWGDPESRTHREMRAYITAMVAPHRNDPTIWAWELGNEFNLAADLPNASEHRPPVVPDLGTPTKRTALDELTHAQIRVALKAFALEIRRIETAGKPILSGHAFPRVSAWHQEREHSWTRDTPEQFAEVFRADHPDPVSMLSGRLYEESDLDRLVMAMERSRRERKPLFIGEFGVPGPLDAAKKARFVRMLDRMEELGVPLAAVWVYDYPGQSEDWSITPSNRRFELLELVAERNRRLAKP